MDQANALLGAAKWSKRCIMAARTHHRKLRGRFPQMNRKKFNRQFGKATYASYRKTEQGMKEFNATVQKLFEIDKILCLSEEPDNILMWSYYAQNHAGVVLCFTDQTPNNPLTQAQRVRYVDNMPSLFDDEMMSDMLAGYSGMDEKRLMNKLVYSKSSHWAHEAEWRVYTGRGRTSGSYEDVPFNAAELESVIFGARMKGSDRSFLVKMLRTFYPHVQLLQAKPMPDAYGLSIETADENSLIVSISTKISLLLKVLPKRAFPILKSRLLHKRG